MKQTVSEYKSNNSVYEVLDNVGLGERVMLFDGDLAVRCY